MGEGYNSLLLRDSLGFLSPESQLAITKAPSPALHLCHGKKDTLPAIKPIREFTHFEITRPSPPTLNPMLRNTLHLVGHWQGVRPYLRQAA